MDAAKKLIKHSGLFLCVVTALSLAAPAWAFDAPSFTAPSTITLQPPTGSEFTVGSTGAAITFSVGVSYANDTNCGQCNWLGHSESSNTTPAIMDLFVVGTAGLPPGQHQAVVTLTDTGGTGAAPATITVNYNSQAGTGGGNTTLTSSVNPINLAASSGFSTSVTTSISTASVNPVSINITTSTTSCGSGWLSASNQGNSTISFGSGTSVLVTANATGLSTGVCQGSVTISPSLGTALSVPVTFTVNGGGGGSGSLTPSQNPVNLSFTTGGSLPSQFVSISSSTGITQFNALTNCSLGWLAVNGQTNAFSQFVSNGLTITGGSVVTGLSTGNYICSISLADSNNSGVTLNTITVNLSVNGGGSSGISVSPNPISFSAPFNGAQQQTTITVTNNTGSGGLLSVSANSSGWLSFAGSGVGQTLPAGNATQIGVFANPNGLASNTYNGSLQIQVGSQSTAVPVNFVVGSGGNGGGGNGTLTAAPSTLNFTYQAGTAVNLVSRQSIAFTGPAGSWSAAASTNNSSGNWLTVTPSAGTLPDANQTTVFIQPSGLAAGTYSGTVTITSITGGTASVTVNLSVVSTAPVLIPQPGSLIFAYSTGGALPGAQTVFPANNDGSTLSVTATANDTWVIVNQQAGSNAFSVSIDPTGKNAGMYTSGVTLTEGSAVNSPVTLPVVLIVNGGGTGGNGTLTFSPNNGMAFSSVAGSIPNSQVLSVSAPVSTTFTVAASTSGGGSWLSVSPTSGTTPTNLSVSVNPSGLANNTYSGTLTFSSNGNVQTVGVTLTVSSSTTGGGVTVTCVSSCGTTQPAMSFSAQTGSGSLPAGALSILSASGSSQVSFTVSPSTTSGGSWLSTNAGSSTVTTPFNPLTVNVTSSPGGTALGAGTYNGNLAVTPSGGTTVNVPVTLTLTAPPTVTATPTQLSFTYRAGDAAPASQTITVSGGGQALAFAVTVSPSGQWLSATPALGSTPGTVSVAINPTGLAAGNYSGTVTVAGSGGALGNTAVSVSLTVTAPLPTVGRVVNSASYLANAISPGEILTLFAADAQHPIGPATPVGLQLDSSGNVATTLGGVQVLINGLACPMIYVSSTQVSAVAPYQIAPLVTASVLVKFLGQSSNGVTVNVATTSPGLFTLNSSGSGPAAILNQNGTTNSPNNPANRGDIVVIYLTGEGQTSPAGVTGKVTTVSSTPPLTPGPLLPIAVTIGGQPATYTFAGEAPGFVSGVMQLNVIVPTNINAGDQPVVVSIGSASSQTGVTISLR